MTTSKTESELVTNKLAVVLEAQGINKDRQQELAKAFGGPFDEVGEILKDFDTDKETGELVPGAKAIKVTSIDQFKEMKDAKIKRLALKKARTTIENKRVELKADSLKVGRSIDAIAKFVTAQIAPVEKYLEAQEKYAENVKAKEKAERLAKRTEMVSKYQDPSMYALADMAEEKFIELMDSLEAEEKARVKAAEEAEQKRLEEEAEAEKRRKQLEEDNERLKKEAAEKQAANTRKLNRVNQIMAFGMKWNEETSAYESHDQFIASQDIIELDATKWQELVDAVSAKLKEYRDAEEADRKAQQEAKEKELAAQKAKADAEREKREKLEAADKARKAKEAAAKAKKEEERRQALLAPDKDKLEAYADSIAAVVAPHVETREAGALIDETADFLDRICKNLRNKASEL